MATLPPSLVRCSQINIVRTFSVLGDSLRGTCVVLFPHFVSHLRLILSFLLTFKYYFPQTSRLLGKQQQQQQQ